MVDLSNMLVSIALLASSINSILTTILIGLQLHDRVKKVIEDGNGKH